MSFTRLLNKREFKINFITRVKFSSNSIQNLGNPRVCIVGAGTAGFYAAQYILKHLKDSVVDVIEKLPVPFGLVRFGVAPDHPEVKNVINTFTKTAENERFRFFGNCALGSDVSLRDLRNNYHAVLLTYGAETDRKLGITNENLPHVLSARKFVAWYNGLPGAEELSPNLSGKTAVIVGQGNVAIDVARMLLSPIDILKRTDITDYALGALSRSSIERVFLIGRRGPLQAAFTIKELREILKLPGVRTIWRETDFAGIPEQISSLPRPRKRLTELMLKSLSEQATTEGSKQFLPIFMRTPKSIENDSMIFSKTELKDEEAIATNETECLQADLILPSIGYKSICVDDGICFDERNGRVFNVNGRVLKNPVTKEFDLGLYVAGWLATGPTGVILTTMNNAFAVAKAICDDFESNKIEVGQKNGVSLAGKHIVTWEGWQRIDKVESQAGERKGKPREKIININKMLEIAKN